MREALGKGREIALVMVDFGSSFGSGETNQWRRVLFPRAELGSFPGPGPPSALVCPSSGVASTL